MKTDKKNGIRLSYTSNNKYQDSPRSYYLHYIRKIREKVVGSALPFGSAIDEALNVLLYEHKNKLEGTEVVTEGEYITPEKLFETVWTKQEINGKMEDLRVTDKVKYYKSDLDIPNELLNNEDKLMMKKYIPQWVILRRKGLEMIKAYREQVLPHLNEIIEVQEYIRIDNPDGDYIVGYVDLVAKFKLNNTIEHNFDPELAKFNDKVIIFDNKTSSIKYKDDSVLESGQLGTYTAYNNPNYKAEAEGYIVIPKKFRKKKLPKIPIQIIIDKVSFDTVDHQFNEYENTLEGIRLGNFPCTEGCKESPFGCVYSRYCESNGKDMEGLVQIDKKSK